MHVGPAEKSGRLNIGDQIMTINGTSLVGLPLSTCQSIIKVCFSSQLSFYPSPISYLYHVSNIFLSKCVSHLFSYVKSILKQDLTVPVFSQGLKSQSRIKMNIVRCPPVTMVLIRRPDLRYQLGFSVQNGIVSMTDYHNAHHQKPTALSTFVFFIISTLSIWNFMSGKFLNIFSGNKKRVLMIL